MEALLNHGADVNGKNKAGETPLHRAAWGPEYEDKAFKDVLLEDYIETVNYLIKRGALKDDQDNERRTPQQIAFQMRKQYCKYLHKLMKLEFILEPKLD